MNQDSWSKILMVAALEIDSPKFCMIGALETNDNRATSLVDGM